jgi:hypothetical protein
MSAAPAAKGVLIAVDGVDAAALLAAARATLEALARGGISRWDASGVFQDLAVAEAEAGPPSARTLLLLYAADLAFRLRWQIKPALAEGRTVIAAPYVETAVAFGRAAGLPAAWLANLFHFAPRATDRRFVHPSRNVRGSAVKGGFVGFGCDRMKRSSEERSRRRLIDETVARLRHVDRRPAGNRRSKKS